MQGSMSYTVVHASCSYKNNCNQRPFDSKRCQSKHRTLDVQLGTALQKCSCTLTHTSSSIALRDSLPDLTLNEHIPSRQH
eukprot:4567579-Amphidinium_carterae.1